MKAYLDSSFLSSLYLKDAHSAEAGRQAAAFQGELVISSLAETETFNAIELRVFRSQMSRDDARQSRDLLANDLRKGTFASIELDDAVFGRAKSLILDHNAEVGCRTADIVHVAAALETGAEKLFTFDDRQKTLARRVKLTTN